MPAEKHSDSKAMTLWLNEMKKSSPPSQGEELVKAMQKKIAKMYITEGKPSATSKKTCICAPTTHEGSFKCHLHRTSAVRKSSSSVDIQHIKKNNVNAKKILGQPRLSRFGRVSSVEPQP